MNLAATFLPRSVSAIGEIMQLGFVVREWESALSFWIGLGAGPFYISERVETTTLLYRGKPAEIDYSLALGYWGGLQIELIRPNDNAPSIYREWIARHRCRARDLRGRRRRGGAGAYRSRWRCDLCRFWSGRAALRSVRASRRSGGAVRRDACGIGRLGWR
jgi:Glyoxalase/Bleomycin resistance protein/Dioxygenase superfamily